MKVPIGIPSRLAASSYFNSSVAISVHGAALVLGQLGERRYDFAHFHVPVPSVGGFCSSGGIGIRFDGGLQLATPQPADMDIGEDTEQPYPQVGVRPEGIRPGDGALLRYFLHQILRLVRVAGQRYRVAAEAGDTGRHLLLQLSVRMRSVGHGCPLQASMNEGMRRPPVIRR